MFWKNVCQIIDIKKLNKRKTLNNNNNNNNKNLVGKGVGEFVLADPFFNSSYPSWWIVFRYLPLFKFSPWGVGDSQYL